MCDYCGGEICPPTCPRFSQKTPDGGRVFGECSACGATLYKSDIVFRNCEGFVCRACNSDAPKPHPMLGTRFK